MANNRCLIEPTYFNSDFSLSGYHIPIVLKAEIFHRSNEHARARLARVRAAREEILTSCK